MKIISYVGGEGESIVIEKPEDLYPYLDHFQNKMIEMAEDGGNDEAMECSHFISDLMKQTEKRNFGDQEDVDRIEYT